MNTQPATARCADCHGVTTITPTVSLLEFEARCGCGLRIISWAHHADPPTYTAPPIAPQLPLFEEVPK